MNKIFLNPLSAFSKLLFFLLVTLQCDDSKAQIKTLYNYQELSHIYYQKQKDSIAKNWTCPALYQVKATQKKYKEIWDSRTEFITTALANKDFVHEKEVYDYVSDIILQIVTSNKQLLPVQPVLLIDRSPAVNAYAIGGNIIAVNLGLISFAETREDIALVVAHELSHNILNHAEHAMKEKAEWLTSDEYNNSVHSILDSKYERYSRLKKLFENYSFNRSKHQRYHESDADSLAIVLLNNSGISFEPSFFLRLDSADIQYKQPLKNSVKDYFTAYNLTFEDSWTQKRSKGLSTKSYSFKDTTGIADSLKTHPDCKDRYQATISQANVNAKTTPVLAGIKEKATKMLIWNMFDNQNLTSCLYRVLQQKDKGKTDEWYDMMVYNIFSGLYYSDKQLNRFNAIGVTPKEFISKNYYELQNMLEQIPRETLEQYCKQLNSMSFWQSTPPDAKALKTLLNTLNFSDDAIEDKGKYEAAKTFIAGNATSMYCEFADHFKKK